MPLRQRLARSVRHTLSFAKLDSHHDLLIRAFITLLPLPTELFVRTAGYFPLSTRYQVSACIVCSKVKSSEIVSHSDELSF